MKRRLLIAAMVILCILPAAAQNRSRIELGTIETYEGPVLDIQAIYPKSFFRFSAEENGVHVVLSKPNVERLLRLLRAVMPLITDDSYTVQIYTEPRVRLENNYERLTNRMEVFASTLPGKVHLVFYQDDNLKTLSLLPDQVERLIGFLERGMEAHADVDDQISRFRLPDF